MIEHDIFECPNQQSSHQLGVTSQPAEISLWFAYSPKWGDCWFRAYLSSLCGSRLCAPVDSRVPNDLISTWSI